MRETLHGMLEQPRKGPQKISNLLWEKGAQVPLYNAVQLHPENLQG